MSVPAWWPQVVAATSRRRAAAGMLLAHATPVVHDGALRLQFARADIAEAWEASGSQAALDAALKHERIPVRMEGAIRCGEGAVVSGG